MFKRSSVKIGFGMAAAVLACGAAFADNTVLEARNTLSHRQYQVIRNAFSKLHSPEERRMAMAWSDAKKVSETMCRPLALKYFKKQYSRADRVFLGDENNDSLKLEGNRTLSGTGQVREGSNWHYFTFECRLNPATGYATSFRANITKTESYIRQPL